MEDLEREEEEKLSEQAELQRKLLAEQDRQRQQEFARLSEHISDEEADALLPQIQASSPMVSSQPSSKAHTPLSRQPALANGTRQGRRWTAHAGEEERTVRRKQLEEENRRQRKLAELSKIQESAARVREIWKQQDAAQRPATQLMSQQAMSLPRRSTTGDLPPAWQRQRPLSTGSSRFSPTPDKHRPLSLTSSTPPLRLSDSCPGGSASLPRHTTASPVSHQPLSHTSSTPPQQPSQPSPDHQPMPVCSTVERHASVSTSPNPLIRRFSHEQIMKEHEERQTELQRLKEERRQSELAFLETEQQIQSEVRNGRKRGEREGQLVERGWKGEGEG